MGIPSLTSSFVWAMEFRFHEFALTAFGTMDL